MMSIWFWMVGWLEYRRGRINEEIFIMSTMMIDWAIAIIL